MTLFSDNEFAHRVAETLIASVSVALNLLLLYLIAFHSNFKTPVYRVLLAMDASLDLVLSVISLIGQPICFTGGGYHVLISNGFFAGWSFGFDEFIIWMWLNFSLFNVLWIVIQFVYRYAFLCLRDPHRRAERHRIYWCLGIFCAASGIVGVVLNYIYCHTEFGPEALEMNHWDTAQRPVVMGTHVDRWLFKAWIGFWTTSCTISMIVVGVFEIKIKRHFDALGSTSHETTRRMHKDFHRALLAMGICPLITTSPPILFFMVAAYLRWAPGPIQAFLTMAPSSITTFNPLTTMFFMRSYREAIVSVFCKRKRVTASVAPTTCVDGLERATTAYGPSMHPSDTV